MTKTNVPAVLGVFLLVGCANVTFHPGNADGTAPVPSKQTGLKYYTAKPYLLVGPTGNKDAPMKAEIISLPDLEHPTYAIYHPGWGQHIFSLAVSSNGSLSSYGQTADTKIPETIAAVGSLMSGGGALATAVRGLMTPPGPKELVEKAIKQLDDLTTNFDPRGDPAVKKKISKAAEIKMALEKLAGNYSEETLSPVSKDIETLKFDKPESAVQSGFNEALKDAKRYVDDAIEALKPASSKKAHLYEIKMKGGHTTLEEVPLP